MALQFMLAAFLLNVVVCEPLPDASLTYLTTAQAASPLFIRSNQGSSSEHVTRPFNGAYMLQNPSNSNAALLVAAQNPSPLTNFVNPAQLQTQRVFAASVQPNVEHQGTVFQILPAQADETESQQVVSAPRNFVTFTRTPQFIPAQTPQQFVPVQAQQYVPTQVENVVPAQPEDAQSRRVVTAPRNFVTFTRVPQLSSVQVQPIVPMQAQPQQFVPTEAKPQQFAPAQTGPQQVPIQRTLINGKAKLSKQFGLRTVFAPASNAASSEPAPAAINTAQSGFRTVVVIPSQQRLQATLNSDRSSVDKTVSKPRTALVGTPVKEIEEPQTLNQVKADSNTVVSSSQYFTRNFGGTGTVTYYIQPLTTSGGNSNQSVDADN